MNESETERDRSGAQAGTRRTPSPRWKLRNQRPTIPDDSTPLITPCEPWPRPFFYQDGLRRVEPYHFTYNTYCKERWRGREVLDIFASEFRDRPLEYYKAAIERGDITLNGIAMTPQTVVKNGDMITHTIHRHEPPVTAEPVRVIHEDGDIIVINKPAGVPVHPAGRYNYNSVVEILRSDRGYEFNPMPCNRLDRLTSGIMFIGKHKAAAERVSEQIRERTVEKEYLARVVGEFPDGEVVCEQPILSISPKLGLNRVRANGKDAKTVFYRVAYYPSTDAGDGADRPPSSVSDNDDNNTESLPWRNKRGYSIVRCLPLTGRTHQIRVHLQFLGHPIANDPIYSNQRVFGPALGVADADGADDDDVITRLSRMGKDEVADAVAYHDDQVDRYLKRRAEKMTGGVCDVCETPLYSDPGPHELGLWLHAKRYSSADGAWSYETDVPAWATDPDAVTTVQAPFAVPDPRSED